MDNLKFYKNNKQNEISKISKYKIEDSKYLNHNVGI